MIFESLFDELSRVNDRSIIWNNWLDYCININLMQHESLYCPKSFMDNEETYYLMFKEWITRLNHELESKPYYDLLGYLYEDNVQSKGKQKDFQQYYTPQSVTGLMTDLIMDKDYNGFTSDPCCGSGRFLLATHYQSKGGLYCIGQDLDETSCKMTVLNFYSHGVKGSVLHMNTLTSEFYKGWRVNRWLLHGIPVPHIEEITDIREAYNFFDVNHGEVNVNESVEADVNESLNSKSTSQTTLI